MKRQTEFNPLAFTNSWKAGKKTMAQEVKERPMEKTGGCLRVTGHPEMTMIMMMMRNIPP